eukprot:scaffold160682_cov26-Tisochrysis_lutea.AAC.2
MRSSPTLVRKSGQRWRLAGSRLWCDSATKPCAEIWPDAGGIWVGAHGGHGVGKESGIRPRDAPRHLWPSRSLRQDGDFASAFILKAPKGKARASLLSIPFLPWSCGCFHHHECVFVVSADG